MTSLPQLPPPLTWNDLKDSVLLHVCRQVAGSHLVVLDLDGRQLLGNTGEEWATV